MWPSASMVVAARAARRVFRESARSDAEKTRMRTGWLAPVCGGEVDALLS
jgi:hypothetical protein